MASGISYTGTAVAANPIRITDDVLSAHHAREASKTYYQNIDPQALARAILDGLNLSDPSSYIQSAYDIANLNTMTSQALAREQMAFQTDANAKAMDFSALEAQKARNWEEMMSNTAHQREVKDLIAAGLNPILSANQGASTPVSQSAQGVTSSGAKGTVDTSAVSAITQAYLKAKELEMQEKNLAVQNRSIDAQLLMNTLNNETTKYAADRGAAASIYGSGAMASANRYSALLSAEASKYASDLNYSTWEQGYHDQTAQLLNFIMDLMKDDSPVKDLNISTDKPTGKGPHMIDADDVTDALKKLANKMIQNNAKNLGTELE